MQLTFLHEYSEDEIENWFNILIANNKIKNILVDKVLGNNYIYSHDFDFLKNKFDKVTIIDKDYTYGRIIMVFSKYD